MKKHKPTPINGDTPRPNNGTMIAFQDGMNLSSLAKRKESMSLNKGKK